MTNYTDIHPFHLDTSTLTWTSDLQPCPPFLYAIEPIHTIGASLFKTGLAPGVHNSGGCLFPSHLYMFVDIDIEGLRHPHILCTDQ